MPDLTPEMLAHLLRRLDPDPEAAGEEYKKLRSRLVKIFEYRGFPSPDEPADEAINRVAQKLYEGANIYSLNGYLISVARYVSQEFRRVQATEREALHALRHTLPRENTAELERRDRCLSYCIQRLSPGDHTLLLQYLQGEGSVRIKNRQRLAEQLNIGLETLRVRYHRIREKLKECLYACLERAHRL